MWCPHTHSCQRRHSTVNDNNKTVQCEASRSKQSRMQNGTQHKHEIQMKARSTEMKASTDRNTRRLWKQPWAGTQIWTTWHHCRWEQNKAEQTGPHFVTADCNSCLHSNWTLESSCKRTSLSFHVLGCTPLYLAVLLKALLLHEDDLLRPSSLQHSITANYYQTTNRTKQLKARTSPVE